MVRTSTKAAVTQVRHAPTALPHGRRANCKECPVRKVMLFSALSESAVDRMLGPIDSFVYPEGTALYTKGDPTDWVYSIREGVVKNITDFGVFIGIDEGIDGLVHISDISWTKLIKHPSEGFKKGQEIQAVVLNIDEEAERFSLGIKQLTGDPWDEIPKKYKPGTRITGTVTNITDFGVFVEIEEGIEGLIHISEVASDKSSGALSRYKVDDVIQAKVINVSRKDKKIGLSIKRLEESEERDIYASYLNNKQGATSNLGDLIKEGMSQLASQERYDDNESAETLSDQKQDEESSETVPEGQEPKSDDNQ